MDYFKVTAKDGSTSYYGAQGNHNSEWKGRNESGAVQNNIIYSWGLTTFKDNLGNTIHYRYTQGNTHYRLDEIEYAFSSRASVSVQSPPSSDANARVKFHYSSGPDQGLKYNAGYVFREQSRLDRIETYNRVDSSEELLRTYHLNYKEDIPRRLRDIQECVESSCLPSLYFDWGPAANMNHLSTVGGVSLTPLDSSGAFLQHTFADIDGDGRQDLFFVEVKDNGDFRAAYAIQNDSGNLVRTGLNWPITKQNSKDAQNFRLSPIDINVDGRMDIAMYDPTVRSWKLFLSEPQTNGEWKLSKESFSFPTNDKDMAFADLNSDAVADAYLATSQGLKRYYLRQKSGLTSTSTAYRFDTSPDTITSSSRLDGRTISLGDVNGDGSLDYIGVSRRANNDAQHYPDDPDSDYTDEVLECDVREQLVVGVSSTQGGVSWQALETHSKDSKPHYDYIDSCADMLDSTHASIGNVLVADVNGDGAVDILYATSSIESPPRSTSLKPRFNTAYYRLGKGDGTFGSRVQFGGNSIQHFGLMDYDSDGDADIYFRSSSNIRLYSWQDNAFSTSYKTLQSSLDDNKSVQYFDYTGDGTIDRISSEFTRFSFAKGKTVYEQHKITAFNTGYGVSTEISYEPLSLTEAYARTEGITVDSQNYEQDYSPAPGVTIKVPAVRKIVNADAFYQALNDPFSEITSSNVALYEKAPVLEFMAPMSVVTKVESTSPSYSSSSNKIEPTKAAVAYIYGEAKMQAGGRGFLGFKSLKTVDLQTLVETTTTYRQDWPFIGTPLRTIVKTKDGHTLSEASTESRALIRGTSAISETRPGGASTAGDTSNYATSIRQSNIDSALQNGSKVLGPVQIYTHKQIEHSYAFSEGQVSQGSLLKTSEVETPLVDHFGNVKAVVTKQYNGSGLEQSSQIVNSYYLDSSNLPLSLGRLTRTVAVSDRPNVSSKTRTAYFSYYGDGSSGCSNNNFKGMLCAEQVEATDVSDSLKTFHYYDDFGNQIFNKQVANDLTRVSALTEFDRSGRYPVATYGVFSDDAGPSVSSGNSEYDGAGLGSVQLTSEVLLFDKHGIPLQVHNYIGGGNYVANWSATTPFGNTYFKASSTGAHETTYASFSMYMCPVDSGAFYAVYKRTAGGGESGACFDILGRKVSTFKKGFSGSRIHSSVRYDIQSRTIASSEPYTGSSTPYWTDIKYDTLGRVKETHHPFDKVTRTTSKTAPHDLGKSTGVRAVSRIAYNGLTTTFTNAEGQSKTEVKNVLGEVVSVSENAGRSARYEYDAIGKLKNVFDSNGTRLTHITYDGLGRKRYMEDKDKGTWNYKYNGLGELTCQQDAENNVVSNVYDLRGRLLSRTDYRNSSCSSKSTSNIVGQASWVYDSAQNGLGKLASEQDSKAQYAKHYNYDNLGRVSTSMEQFPGVNGELTEHYQKVTYDRYGRAHQNFDAARVSKVFNNNGTQNVYNSYGYLSKVVNAVNTSEQYYQVTAMNARGQVTQHRLGKNVNVNSGYSAASGLQTSVNSNSLITNATLRGLSLKWDHLGNLLYRKESTFGGSWERYVYNSNNELETNYLVNGSNETSQTVTYNNIGNIRFKTGMGSYSYNSTRPHAVSSTASHSYSYDLNGNLTAETNTQYNRLQRQFTYSAFSKVTHIDVYDMQGAAGTVKAEVDFSYGTGRNRFKRVDTNHENNKVTTTLYAGGVEKVFTAMAP